jgi:hypothetical protein
MAYRALRKCIHPLAKFRYVYGFGPPTLDVARSRSRPKSEQITPIFAKVLCGFYPGEFQDEVRFRPAIDWIHQRLVGVENHYLLLPSPRRAIRDLEMTFDGEGLVAGINVGDVFLTEPDNEERRRDALPPRAALGIYFHATLHCRKISSCSIRVTKVFGKLGTCSWKTGAPGRNYSSRQSEMRFSSSVSASSNAAALPGRLGRELPKREEMDQNY